MKVAIITLQLHTNYGGVLQAFALQRVLEAMGNEVEIIQSDKIMPEPEGAAAVRKFLTRSFRKYALRRSDVEIFRERRINGEFPIIGKEFVRFFRKYLNIRYISSFSEIRASDYDAFVVGSDQVWRPIYNPALMHSFLDFTWENDFTRGGSGRTRVCSSAGEESGGGRDVRRIAYAVSFGCDAWEYTERQTALAAGLAGRFNALSFRENSGVKNAAEHLGVEAVTVLDPTMLLDAEDYLRLVGARGNSPKDFREGCTEDSREGCTKDSRVDSPKDFREGCTEDSRDGFTAGEQPGATCGESPENDGNSGVNDGNFGVFEYVLDNTAETADLVASLERQLAIPVRRFLGADPRGREEISLRVQPSVESWIEGIADAGFVLTDSFHACVFSILFHRPFAVVGNRSRGLSRIIWLLEQFGLESRLLCNMEDSIPESEIDWESVDARLGLLRAESFEFLRANLS